MFERFQKYILLRVSKVINVSKEPGQKPKHAPGVRDHELFKCIDVTRLDPSHNFSIRVLGHCNIGHRTGLFDGRIQISWREYPLWGEIRYRPEAHLERIQEVAESCHHHPLKHPLFAKPLTTEKVNVLELELGGADGKLERKIH